MRNPEELTQEIMEQAHRLTVGVLDSVAEAADSLSVDIGNDRKIISVNMLRSLIDSAKKGLVSIDE